VSGSPPVSLGDKSTFAIMPLIAGKKGPGRVWERAGPADSLSSASGPSTRSVHECPLGAAGHSGVWWVCGGMVGMVGGGRTEVGPRDKRRGHFRPRIFRRSPVREIPR
jgi:hypothetical protein